VLGLGLRSALRTAGHDSLVIDVELRALPVLDDVARRHRSGAAGGRGVVSGPGYVQSGAFRALSNVGMVGVPCFWLWMLSTGVFLFVRAPRRTAAQSETARNPVRSKRRLAALRELPVRRKAQDPIAVMIKIREGAACVGVGYRWGISF
jgi:hypothetical protein